MSKKESILRLRPMCEPMILKSELSVFIRIERKQSMRNIEQSMEMRKRSIIIYISDSVNN